jgi:hypothetical protein
MAIYWLPRDIFCSWKGDFADMWKARDVLSMLFPCGEIECLQPLMLTCGLQAVVECGAEVGLQWEDVSELAA